MCSSVHNAVCKGFLPGNIPSQQQSRKAKNHKTWVPSVFSHHPSTHHPELVLSCQRSIFGREATGVVKLPWPFSGSQWPPRKQWNSWLNMHPVLCAQLQEAALPRVFGQGTLPAQALPLRVGKETLRHPLQLTTEPPCWWPPPG